MEEDYQYKSSHGRTGVSEGICGDTSTATQDCNELNISISTKLKGNHICYQCLHALTLHRLHSLHTTTVWPCPQSYQQMSDCKSKVILQDQPPCCHLH